MVCISSRMILFGRKVQFWLDELYLTLLLAITLFTEHYTEPGDIVFDGLCGTGMTGVAAEMCGRRAVLCDPATASHLRARSWWDSQPEKTLSRLAVISATPSIRPMMLVLTPSTPERNSGRRLITISLEMSMKKLVRLTAHTLRGSERIERFSEVFIFPSGNLVQEVVSSTRQRVTLRLL